jgi:predicted metal-dependent enzyme (double-stranded beta helix superfamily)
MNPTDEFVTQCRGAAAEGAPPAAAQELLQRATKDARLAKALGRTPGVNVLHNGADITILHVVMEPRPDHAGDPIPHDHRLWAVIGVLHGSEENRFFRRAESGLELSGVEILAPGDVLAMDEDAIHSVRNPSNDQPSGALHVYGGDLISAEKSMWSEGTQSEQPFDFFRVVAS